MIPLPRMKDRKVRVVGLGPAGRATAAALAASGAEVSVWDDDAERRTREAEALGLLAKGPRASLSGVDAVILCDGALAAATKQLLPKVRAGGVALLTDFDLFAQALDEGAEDGPRVVGVTGVAGKSVTANMIAHIVRSAGRRVHVTGDVTGDATNEGADGSPCLALPAPQANDVYVVELPPGRLAATQRFACDVAVVLGMEGARGGLDGALRAVTRLTRHQRPGGAAVIAADDNLGAKVCAALQGAAAIPGGNEVIPVSAEATLGHGIFVLGHQAYAARDGRTQALGDLSRALAVQAPHLALDAAAAIAATLTLGLSPPAILKALHALEPLPGRFAPIGNAGRVLVVDDSHARSAACVARALAAAPDVFWITMDDAAVTGGAETPSLRQTYRVNEDGLSLEDAFDAALGDASALAAREPDAAPVVLFAPGTPADPDAFARIAARRLGAPGSGSARAGGARG